MESDVIRDASCFAAGLQEARGAGKEEPNAEWIALDAMLPSWPGAISMS